MSGDADVPAWTLAHAWPPLGLCGRIRTRAEDFQVIEELGFAPDGEGEHVLLRVRKTGCNTQWVARSLARAGGVAERDVGYSGLKDRHAVTEQWFSLPRRAAEPLRAIDLSASGIEILDLTAHRRKLRRGVHRRNRFRIVIRELSGADGTAAIDQRLQAIAKQGVPNYFGAQRFGRDGGNLALVRQLAAGEHLPRQQRGFALSAGRSQVFNALLSARVERGSWCRLLPGDLAVLQGSRSVFPVMAVDPVMEQRIEAHDIHPSGPLWGRGNPPSEGEAARLERSVADDWPECVAVVNAAGMDHERRALRLTVEDLQWAFEGGALVLSFSLSRGGFATVVLRELLDFSEGHGDQALLRNNT